MIVLAVFLKCLIKKQGFGGFEAVLCLGKPWEWAVGSPRAPANLPEWSWNDLEKNIFLESRSVNIFDFNVFSTFCDDFNSLG